MTMKKLIEKLDALGASEQPKQLNEGVDPTNTDAYFSGYSARHNSLYGKPQPKNPHPAGSIAAKNWEFDREQGERDRRQEMGESDIDEAKNHLGDREYSTYNGWKAACRKAYPGCTFYGDRDIGGANLNGKDVGEWDGSVGCVYNSSMSGIPMTEEDYALDEISQATKDSYVEKAVTDHGHHAFMARNTQNPDEQAAFAARANKRAQGINRALGGNMPVGESKLDEKSTSEKQARFMAAAAHDSKFAKKAGIDQSVAKEFNKADTGTKQLSNAMKHVDESEELDEISGSTLGSYIQKARADRSKKIEHGKELDADEKVVDLRNKVRGWYDSRQYKRDGSSVHRSKIDKAHADIEKRKKKIDPNYPKSADAHKRYRGIEKAAAKLTTGKLTDSVTESKIGTGVTVILEGVKFRVSDPSLAKILRRFPHEAENFNAGADLDDDLYDELYDFYAGNGEMPYGTMKARNGDPYEWVSQRLAREMDVAHTEMFEDEGDSELETITRRFAHEVKLFKEGGDLDDDLYHALFDYYSDNAEMPYGVAKARTGDPFQWVSDRFAQDLGSLSDAPMTESPYPELVGDGVATEGIDESLLMELSEEEKARITSMLEEIGLDEGLDFFFEGEHLVVIGRTTARLAINKVGGHIQSIDGEEVRIGAQPKNRPQPAKQDVDQLSTVEPELEEATDGYADNWMKERKASKVMSRVDELQKAIDGIEQEKAEWFRRGYDTSELDMDISAYKTEIEELLGGLEPLEGLGESTAVTIQSDCDEELLNVLRRLSGMEEKAPAIAVIEPEVEVEEAIDGPEDGTYDNEPDPSIHTSTERMFTQGDDLNRIKRQYPQAANPAANPMAEARALMRDYDSMMKGLKK